ncbi:MAG: adenylate/guanylate cyclase domain-containing protein [Bifidobacteriaceae bacterium]|jgi:adenylate cyclase|nr:adenylate/guanylate cyclase domain-containing protein [Bifidobacteriaceae bacterium]
MTELMPSPAPLRSRYTTVEDLAQTAGGDSPSLSLSDLEASTGLDARRIQTLCHAIGLPPVTDPDAITFTARDAQELSHAAAAVDSGVIDAQTQLNLFQAAAATAERLAWSQIETIMEFAARTGAPDGAPAQLAAIDRVAGLADQLEAQMTYVWRHQLARAVRRIGGRAVAAQETPAGSAQDTARAVGFADLVDYTAVTGAFGRAELDALVQEFTAVTRDIVAQGGGRIVKTLGDAVMFVTEDAAHGANIALGLAEALGATGHTPPARVALAFGPVLGRYGDVFGTTVNRASRLADIAEPTQVLIDEPTARQLQGTNTVAVTPRPAVELAGLGPVRPYRLDRAAQRVAA